MRNDVTANTYIDEFGDENDVNSSRNGYKARESRGWDGFK